MDNRSPSCYSNAKCGIFFATTINYYVIILIKLLHLTAQVIIASGYTKLRTCNVAKILSADLIHLTGEMQNQQECLIALVFFFIRSGEKLGMWLSLFPTIYLSAGSATALILVGGETMKLFYQIVCGPICSPSPISTIEWYLVFTSLAIVLSQLPNLNSIAGVSLIGGTTAITYCTMSWVLSVSQPRPPTVSYEPQAYTSLGSSLFSTLNALGIIAFAFRGHNLALEIQVCPQETNSQETFCTLQLPFGGSVFEWAGICNFFQATMPSTFKHPAHVPMWRGAKVAYALIAMCLFPVAIGGYWAYGNMASTTWSLDPIVAALNTLKS